MLSLVRGRWRDLGQVEQGQNWSMLYLHAELGPELDEERWRREKAQ
jgi:hypothetical protein